MSLAFCIYDGYICFVTDVGFNIEHDTQTLHSGIGHKLGELVTTESQVSGSMDLYTKYEEVLDGSLGVDAYIDLHDRKIYLGRMTITDAVINPTYEKVHSYKVEWIANDITIEEK